MLQRAALDSGDSSRRSKEEPMAEWDSDGTTWDSTPAAESTDSGSEMLLVGSKTRAALKAHGCNVGGDALEALNEVVHWFVEQGASRAVANGRKTVRGHDFMVK
ncbi:uncharacterized protein METZ01_LOCUS174648 [marine metagenome]|uniref:Transcription factor CBF/NF-Y/archaeal histone domain-containing protein n=1 Tax=marine metagenome TaxID=408172 RepID=A0A382C7D0_9ZZZZ